MGSWFSSIFGKYSNDPLRTILIGLDNAGKTTLLYRTHSDETLATIPTIGFNVETVEYKNINFTVRLILSFTNTIFFCNPMYFFIQLLLLLSNADIYHKFESYFRCGTSAVRTRFVRCGATTTRIRRA